MVKKKACYVLMLSEVFSKTHPKAGQKTHFIEQFNNGQKIHTIRENYELWKKRFEKIEKDEAYISVRKWENPLKPYRSKQIIIKDLHKSDGIGLGRIQKTAIGMSIDGIIGHKVDKISKNDGLEIEDFNLWFRHVELLKPCALIYLNDFRY